MLVPQAYYKDAVCHGKAIKYFAGFNGRLRRICAKINKANNNHEAMKLGELMRGTQTRKLAVDVLISTQFKIKLDSIDQGQWPIELLSGFSNPAFLCKAKFKREGTS